MARIRSIKPELATSRKLASVAIEARYTLVLLVTQADDDGLVYAEPRQLLGALYPHDESVTPDALESWLLALAKIKSIALRYTRDGARVVQIVGWEEHQVVKNRAKPKILPTLLPSSVDPPSDLLESSRAEVVVRKGEVGSRKGEEEASAAADLSGHFTEPTHRTAYLAYRSAHRMPATFDANLSAAVQGMHGKPVPWEDVGRALVEMGGAGAQFSARALAGFLRKLHDDTNGSSGPSTADYLAQMEREGKL